MLGVYSVQFIANGLQHMIHDLWLSGRVYDHTSQFTIYDLRQHHGTFQ